MSHAHIASTTGGERNLQHRTRTLGGALPVMSIAFAANRFAPYPQSAAAASQNAMAMSESAVVVHQLEEEDAAVEHQGEAKEEGGGADKEDKELVS